MDNKSKKIVSQIADKVKNSLNNEASGHDWWHIYRVWMLAKRISKIEGGNALVIELAALLHDIADWKEFNGDLSVGPKIARELLHYSILSPNEIDHICQIIATMSFKGSAENDEMATIEGKIVQDADRLDAIGAIGIARAFTYGGHKGKILFDPGIKQIKNMSKAQYIKNSSTSINHFYEKLLLLKDKMKTKTGKNLAKNRHIYMQKYLDRFYKEWRGSL